ncbi:hypothetical protein [Chryseobacterium wanjuense]
MGFESGNGEKPFVMGTHYNGSENKFLSYLGK